MTQFGRRAGVQIAGLLITDHRIRFNVRRRSDRTADDGHIDIFNLARPTEQRIKDRGVAVQLEAGYAGAVGVIFSGSAQRVERDRRVSGGVARITRIHLSDSLHTPDPTRIRYLGGVSARSYGGAVPVRAVAADLVRDLGLQPDGLEAIPGSATVTNWVFTGQTTDGLASLLRSVGCSFYDDDGVVRVRRHGVHGSGDAPGFLLTPQTGLVGSPKDTDEGVTVTMLLNPAVRVESGIRLRAEDRGGDYRVVEVSHVGDTWEGRFVTVAECRDL